MEICLFSSIGFFKSPLEINQASGYNAVVMLTQRTPSEGERKYIALQPELEKKHDSDDYVVVDPKSGEYFVGETSVEAMKKARAKYPRGKLFLAQVGRLAGLMK